MPSLAITLKLTSYHFILRKSSKCIMFLVMVQTNLIEERVCLHSDLGKNKSVNCYNMTAAEQEVVQPAVANLQLIKNLIETLVPCVTALFLGPWSDVNGRLPLFLAAISGEK